MASTTGSSLHNGDVEKTAGAHHANGSHGVTGVSTGSPAYASQEGGAPLNLRNITPGGHPLDRVRLAFEHGSARSSNIPSPADFHLMTRAEPTRLPDLPPSLRQPCASGTLRFRPHDVHALAHQR